MPFVLDASIALGWYLSDEESAYGDRMLPRVKEDGAVVPSIWPLEMANGFLAAERRGRLSPAAVAGAVKLVLSLPITVEDVTAPVALGPVLDIARAQRLTTYDAAYLELAVRQGAALATEDVELRAAAKRVGVPLVE